MALQVVMESVPPHLQSAGAWEELIEKELREYCTLKSEKVRAERQRLASSRPAKPASAAPLLASASPEVAAAAEPQEQERAEDLRRAENPDVDDTDDDELQEAIRISMLPVPEAASVSLQVTTSTDKLSSECPERIHPDARETPT